MLTPTVIRGTLGFQKLNETTNQYQLTRSQRHYKSVPLGETVGKVVQAAALGADPNTEEVVSILFFTDGTKYISRA